MTANGVTEKLWTVLNLAQKVMKGGWGPEIFGPIPPMRGQGPVKKTPEALSSLTQRYTGSGTGASAPSILAVTGEKLLEEEELAYFGKWLEALGIKTEDSVYFITAPQSAEDRETLGELALSLGVKVVFALGESAAQKVLSKRISLPILRGQDYTVGSMVVLPSYHPRQVLEDQTLKKPVWEDLKRLKGIINYA